MAVCRWGFRKSRSAEALTVSTRQELTRIRPVLRLPEAGVPVATADCGILATSHQGRQLCPAAASRRINPDRPSV